MSDITKKKELITRIVQAEWEFFTNVQNIGGRAACQEDYKTFEINRTSQALSWSEATLNSYLSDLVEAEKNGRNLMTEKYARMMHSTSPQEYAAIQHLLPPLDSEVTTLIDKIVPIVMEWDKELSRRYPHFFMMGRPLYSSEDTPYVTSKETYLKGELATYSSRTLRSYFEDVLRYKSESINGSEVILEYMVKRYGYKSLDEANEKIKGGK
jgi:hypothetical protein